MSDSAAVAPQPGPSLPPPPAAPQADDVRTHPRGALILVLGILGLVGPAFLAPFAWAMGSRAQREMAASGHEWTNQQLVVAGKVLGIIGTVLLGLVLIPLIVLASAFVMLGATSANAMKTDGSAGVFLAVVFAVLMLLGWNMSRSNA